MGVTCKIRYGEMSSLDSGENILTEINASEFNIDAEYKTFVIRRIQFYIKSKKNPFSHTAVFKCKI